MISAHGTTKGASPVRTKGRLFVRSIVALGKVVVLVAVGCVLGVFSTFAAVFTDKHSQSDYVFALAMVGIEFLVVAGVAALLLRSWRYPFWLCLPSIPILWWYSTRETENIQFHLAVLAALLIGTALGALGGAAVRARSGRQRVQPGV